MKILGKKELIELKDILKIEKEFNFKFPKVYIDFLLDYNGGKTEWTVFNAEGYGSSILNDLYGIYSDDNIRDIENNLRVFKNRVPEEFVPIGNDELGNQIIIGVKGEYINKVYFWWHEGESETEVPVYNNVYLISENFETFLDSLEELVEEKKEGIEKYFEEEDYSNIKKLIDSGWDLNTPLSIGLRPVEFMVQRNNKKIVNLLIDKGANIEGVINHAINNKLNEMLELLLQAGANPNEHDNMNRPALHQAIMSGNLEATKILLNYKADKFVKDKFGRNSIALAEKVKSRGEEEDMDKIIELLK